MSFWLVLSNWYTQYCREWGLEQHWWIPSVWTMMGWNCASKGSTTSSRPLAWPGFVKVKKWIFTTIWARSWRRFCVEKGLSYLVACFRMWGTLMPRLLQKWLRVSLCMVGCRCRVFSPSWFDRLLFIPKHSSRCKFFQEIFSFCSQQWQCGTWLAAMASYDGWSAGGISRRTLWRGIAASGRNSVSQIWFATTQ